MIDRKLENVFSLLFAIYVHDVEKYFRQDGVHAIELNDSDLASFET